MNLSQLKTLVAIADHGGFALAAEHLYITPAAVSHQMRTLEADLGCAVFDRSTRPPRLNPHGRSVVDRGREVLRGFDALIESARAPGELAGRLVVGCVSGVSSALIPAALASLRASHPSVRVRIEEGLSEPLANRVRRRELDAAIITELPVPDPELESLPILEEAMAVVAPPGAVHPSWREALVAYPFLRLNRQAGMGSIIDRMIRESGLVVREAMELDSSETIVSLAQAGLGVGVVPAGRIEGLDPTTFTTFAFGDPPAIRRVVLTERRNNQRSALSRVLYEALRSLVE